VRARERRENESESESESARARVTQENIRLSKPLTHFKETKEKRAREYNKIIERESERGREGGRERERERESEREIKSESEREYLPRERFAVFIQTSHTHFKETSNFRPKSGNR
jgi:hypothetical protein